MITPTMTAAACTRYGPPDVVRLVQVGTPTAGAGEVLVRVRATTVNRTDCGYRGAKPFLIRFFTGIRRPKQPILGTEFAGEVVALGDGVTDFAVGDRICEYCEGTFGAHAQYMTIGEHRLVARIPRDRSFEDAAPSTEGAHYALGMLRRAGIGPGDDVLVNGATGAIGSAAVQIAKSMGARVTAVCGPDHLALVRGLGADRVVDYTAEDFTRDAQRYDLVLDAVGKSSFRRCRRLLRPQGRYVSSDLGWLAQNPILALVTPLVRRRRVLFVVPRADPQERRFLRGLIESGEFRPVLDRTYPLAEIVEAYRFVETGRKVGNVVIVVP